MKVSVLKYSFIAFHLVIMFEVVLFTLTNGLSFEEMSYICTTMIAGIAAYSHLLYAKSMGKRFDLEISNTLLIVLIAWFFLMSTLLLIKSGIIMKDSFVKGREPFSALFGLLESTKALFVAALIPKIFPQET